MSLQKSSPQVDAHPIPQEAFDWYDEYAHGVIDRRTFMARLGTITTASLTMGMILPVLMPNYEAAEQVSFNDEAINEIGMAYFLESEWDHALIEKSPESLSSDGDDPPATQYLQDGQSPKLH